MTYQYTIQELNELSVVDLINLNIINPIHAKDYTDSNATMYPYQFFLERGMIQTVPINFSRLIPDAKASGGDLKEIVKFCMIKSNGTACPGIVRNMLIGSTCYKCFNKQSPANICSKCGAVLID